MRLGKEGPEFQKQLKLNNIASIEGIGDYYNIKNDIYIYTLVIKLLKYTIDIK